MASTTTGIGEQIAGAYKLMSEKALYRPAAPSDGCGNITVPPEALNLAEECRDYAVRWWEEEDACKFFVGCCNYSTRPATIFALEAARCMCAGTSGNKTALRLLQLAVESLKSEIGN